MSDFSLLNPNTGNCPIFRTQADAELTKAIYRRVPVLWREASDGQPEVNPWRLTFKALFHMANDSHHFRTEEDLLREGLRREGNVYVGRDVRATTVRSEDAPPVRPSSRPTRGRLEAAQRGDPAATDGRAKT